MNGMGKVDAMALETDWGGVPRKKGDSKMGILSPSDWEAEVFGQ